MHQAFLGPDSIVRSLHTSYFTAQTLQEFCDFILDTYQNNGQILDDYNRENTQYHISGMSLASLFFRNRLNNTVDLLQLRQENGEQQESSFDERMAEIRGFDEHRQLDMMVKRIVWEQSTSGRGISLVKRLPSGQILLLRSLHFSRWYQMTDTVFSVKRR